ncbi:hypothetical protein G7Y89_g8405 [Cudoniella acicularis]|uniref:CorA-like transporter domain-containing protein n=1 Tax=Cudoniella acicularis TaxID=354080 RepID=A0A8H4W140_9HELO|nr:hypothetical protein G7Y89_g8405 [Cudoniella acicularis]
MFKRTRTKTAEKMVAAPTSSIFKRTRTKTIEKKAPEDPEAKPEAFKFTTELRETGYIAEADLKAKLVELFGEGDYQISTKQERWIYFAPRKLTTEETNSSVTSEKALLERADEDEEWRQYPTNLKDFDSVAFDSTAHLEKLDRLEDVSFSTGTRLNVLESGDSSNLVKTRIESEDELDKFLGVSALPELQILSISQQYSLAPLNISKSALLKICSRYQVSPEFLDVVYGFGDKKVSADEVHESGSYNGFVGSNYEISYQLRYMENNKRLHGDPWSLRQTGVYHQYSGFGTDNVKNLWILLHPIKESIAYKRLDQATFSELRVHEMEFDPMRLHLLVFSSYIDNWRLYLHDITRQFLVLEDKLMTTELRDRELNFETLQTLSHLAGKLIPIPAILEASARTIVSIREMNKRLASFDREPELSQEELLRIAKTGHSLQATESRLQSYLASFQVLHARIENLKKFLADGLNLQNQDIAAEANGLLLTLTKDTVDDSATVRLVTLVTLIFLPASFISSLLGTNLFAFDPNTTNFEISRQFWIWVVTTVPLTLLTIGYWKYITYRQQMKKAREAREQMPGIV